MLPIRVPALRERREDIPALVEVLGEDLAQRSGAVQPELLPEAMGLLAAQSWRGNIRELRNVLEQALLRGDSLAIDAGQLAAVLRESGVEPQDPVVPEAASHDGAGSDLLRPLAEQVAELEQRAIAAALKTHKGNKVAAARLLGISRATLYARIEHMSNIQSFD